MANYLKFQALANNCTISLGPCQETPSIHAQFSTNGTNWVNDSITLQSGQTCFYRMEGGRPTFNDNEPNTFTFTADVAIIGGNITGTDNPTTIFGYNAYKALFRNCIHLKSIYQGMLPYTDIRGESEFESMFEGCTGLTSLPSGLLPAHDVATRCYKNMFKGCTGLTTIPSGLMSPSIGIRSGTFWIVDAPLEGMFSDCTGLTVIPEGSIPDIYVSSVGAKEMFKGCTNLKEIHFDKTQWTRTSGEAIFTDWLLNVSPTGDFYCDASLPQIFDSSHIPVGWTVHKGEFLIFKAVDGPCTITHLNFQFYAEDGGGGGNSITIAEGEKALVKGNGYPSRGNHFSISGKAEIIGGNVMMLVGAEDPTTITKEAGFEYLFQDCAGLVGINANLLPATTLAEDCYRGMFTNCTGLTSLPPGLLPAVDLTSWCYCGMFSGCQGLTAIPEGLLPATNLAEHCYQMMFIECSNITEVPFDLLPATVLAESCYAFMFKDCFGLVVAPNLPATEMVTDCYKQMFYEDYHLNEVHVGLTSWGDDVSTTNQFWLADVAAVGDFYAPEELPDQRGISYIPTNWNLHRPEPPTPGTPTATYLGVVFGHLGFGFIELGEPEAE